MVPSPPLRRGRGEALGAEAVELREQVRLAAAAQASLGRRLQGEALVTLVV